jgi:hypothetical protein
MHLSLLPVAAATATTTIAATAAALLFSGRPAVRTASGFVDESFADEELLLGCAERKSHAAIRASKGFVRVLHG